MDFDKFLKFHKSKNTLITICMRPLPKGYKSSSVITLDDDKKIKVFLEKPTMEQIEQFKDEQSYINSGIYAMKKDVLNLIPENQKYDLSKDLFPKLIGEGIPLYGYSTTEFFREIGRVEKYNAFLEEVKGKKEFL